MSRSLPPYDSGPPDDEEGDFSEDSLLPELNGCHCDEAEFLRAIAIAEAGEENNVADLGSLIALSYAAVYSSMKWRRANPRFPFSNGRRYEFFRGPSENGLPLPRRELIKALVKYISKHREMEELVRERPKSELDSGVLELGQHTQVVIRYRSKQVVPYP